MATKTYDYFTSSSNWTRELVAAFGSGFLLATVFWVSVWYFQARPAQADILQAQESELQQAQAALQHCNENVGSLTRDKARLETEVQQLDTLLKRAWASARRAQAQQP